MQPAPHQPRPPASVQACQRPLHSDHDGRDQHQAPLRQSAPVVARLAEAVRTQSRELVLGSSLGIDFYLWLTYRTFTLKRPLRLSWPRLYRQFGVDPVKAGERVTVDNFRKDCLRELKKIKVAWTDLNYVTAPGALVLRPSKPAVPRGASSRRVALRSPSLAQNHPLAACEAIGGGGTPED